ncbi:hypothetical protein [Sphingobacterium corticibacter]|uniref:DUF4595 domain-containing protein n=1 Tax=Sphingobacterium corticibacter TaxID=2171749 RepID=A0A2T8HJ11_9SPHI|nr:hypothetical protein [Sphingobacterium corticibacter]PVH25438.1 hypothetical protein DC487_11040 [Sphingobacterium corticibacter]
MNRLYLLLISVVLAHVAIAQQYQLDSVVLITDDEKYICIQKVKTKKGQTEVVRLERDSQFTVNQYLERISSRYDERGNNLENIYEEWNIASGSWEEMSKSEYEYNSDNEIIQHISSVKNGQEWLKKRLSKSIYAPDKRSKMQTEYVYQNDRFEPTRKIIWLLDDFGEFYHYETLKWSDDATAQTTKLIQSENYYEKDTLLMPYEIYGRKERQWKNEGKAEYELDENNRKKTYNYTLYYGDFDGNWFFDGRSEDIELPEQRKKINRRYNWSEIEQDWELDHQEETFFNDKGEIEAILVSEPDSTSALIIKIEKLYSYDTIGRLKLLQHFYFDGGDNILSGQQSKEFDNEGNIYREDVCIPNHDTNTWKLTFSTEFSYDKNVLLDTDEDRERIYDGMPNEYNYASKKYGLKAVKSYEIEDGMKRSLGEYEYFYSQKP